MLFRPTVLEHGPAYLCHLEYPDKPRRFYMSVPTIVFVPSVAVMGRSVFSRRVMQGMPKPLFPLEAPESVNTNFNHTKDMNCNNREV